MNSRTTDSSRAAVSPRRSISRGRKAAATVAATLGAATVVSTVAPAPAEALFTQRVGTVWGRVADCESSRRWHINTGNGFYGGLQFSHSTWVAYHGNKYAWRADKATRAEQIEVARRVLAGQGPGAWPVCSYQAGLTKRTGGATSNPLPRRAG